MAMITVLYTEMFKHILSTMYNKMNKKVVLWAALCSMLILFGCNKEEPTSEKSAINGIIDNSHPYGVKVTLQNESDPSIKYVAVSDANGSFEFRDIEPGIYSVDAVKDGFRWAWMVDDGVINHKNRLIELSGGKTKELKILMGGGPTFLNFQLELTDIYGNQIGESIPVPKYATTVSFKLYNRTDRSHQWNVNNIDRCLVFDDLGIYYEYTFSSFNPTSGTLAPGDNVVLVGTINQAIFDIRTGIQWPYFNELEFYSEGSKKVLLNIDFD